MKWMIASDLHGSYYYAQQLQQAFEREQADRLRPRERGGDLSQGARLLYSTRRAWRVT